MVANVVEPESLSARGLKLPNTVGTLGKRMTLHTKRRRRQEVRGVVVLGGKRTKRHDER